MGLIDNDTLMALGIGGPSSFYDIGTTSQTIHSANQNVNNTQQNNYWKSLQGRLANTAGSFVGNTASNYINGLTGSWDKTGAIGGLVGSFADYGINNAINGNWDAFSGDKFRSASGNMLGNAVGNYTGNLISGAFGKSELGNIAGNTIGDYAGTLLGDFTNNIVKSGSFNNAFNSTFKGEGFNNLTSNAIGGLAGGLAEYGVNKLTKGKDYGIVGSITNKAVSGAISSGIKQGITNAGLKAAGKTATTSIGSAALKGAASSIGKGGISALGAATGQALSNGRSSLGGQFLDKLGQGASFIPGVGYIVGAALQAAAGGINNLWGTGLKGDKINKAFQENANQQYQRTYSTNFDDLANDFGNFNNLELIDYKDIVSSGKWASNKNIARTSATFGGPDAEMYLNQINRERTKANKQGYQTIVNRGDDLINYQDKLDLINMREFGGNLSTNGAVFPNGLLYIGNGGSHEENPNQGVQMGVDPQGVPNLVEEGETIYKDYVFSKRLKVPNKITKKYKLGGNISYADASKKLAKEAEERPNDPISKNGLNAFMGELASSQEEIRFRKEMNEKRRQARQLMSQLSPEELMALQGQYAHGGKLGNLYDDGSWLMDDYYNNIGVYDKANTSGKLPYSRTMSDADITAARANPSYDAWTKYAVTLPEEDRYWTTLSQNTGMTIPYLRDNFASLRQGKWGYVSETPEYSPANKTSALTAEGLDVKSRVPNVNTSLKLDLSPENRGNFRGLPKDKSPKSTGNPNIPNYDSWMRYVAPTLTALQLGHTLASKPNYKNANKLETLANEMGEFTPITAPRVSNHITYKPMDTDYYARKSRAENIATSRGIMGLSGNRAAAMQGLIAQANRESSALGDLWRTSEEYDAANKLVREQGDNAVDVTNAQMQLQADTSNLTARQQAQAQKANLMTQAMTMREATDTQRMNDINTYIASLGNSFTGMGQEHIDRKTRNWMIENGVYDVPMTTEKKSRGGKIKRRRR